MKYFAVLALTVIATCVASSYAQGNSQIFGTINEDDERIHHQFVIQKSKLLRVVSEDVTFPQKGVMNYRQITGIRITDQYTNGKGGYAKIKSGGIGQNHVTLRFKSQRGHGYNFVLEIFGQ